MKNKKQKNKTLIPKLRSLKRAFEVNDHFQHFQQFKPSNEKLRLSELRRGIARLSGAGQLTQEPARGEMGPACACLRHWRPALSHTGGQAARGLSPCWTLRDREGMPVMNGTALVAAC